MQQATLLFDRDRLDRVIDWMAAQAFPLLSASEDPVLLGVLRRGGPLAVKLQDRLQSLYGLPTARYEIRLRRDPDQVEAPDIVDNVAIATRDLGRATVLVVDDVLDHGASLARVIGYLDGRGARAVHAAVLADRCRAEVRARAGVVGICLPVGDEDSLVCHIPPYEPDFGLYRVRSEAVAA